MSKELSPCINICKVKDNSCISCKRTFSEIASWSSLTNEQRKTIMQELKNRITQK